MPRDKYLLTGAHGFLGTVIWNTLSNKYDVSTLGRSNSNTYAVDLAREIPQLNGSFDVVIHNAGKAHVVPRSDQERKDFFNTNVTGTHNLLEALNKANTFPRAFVFISTIAVYGLTKGENISEQHPLNATDAYGKSKIEAEELISQWCNTHNVALTILRLPLVAGKKPPGNLGAMIKAIRKGYYFGISKNAAQKSIVMAEDVAKIIPEAPKNPGIYHLTDGYNPSFRELEISISTQLGCAPPKSIPIWAASLFAKIGDIIEIVVPIKFPLTSATVEKITSTLTFDDQRARKNLNWNPQNVLDAFIIS